MIKVSDAIKAIIDDCEQMRHRAKGFAQSGKDETEAEIIKFQAAALQAVPLGFHIFTNGTVYKRYNVTRLESGYCYGGFHGLSLENATQLVKERAHKEIV